MATSLKVHTELFFFCFSVEKRTSTDVSTAYLCVAAFVNGVCVKSGRCAVQYVSLGLQGKLW